VTPGTASPIDSPRNSRIVAARALLTRKGRTAAGAFLVEGPHALSEAMAAAGFVIRETFLTEAAADRQRALLRELARRDVPVQLVTERAMRGLGDTTTPQGVVAVVAARDEQAATIPVAPRLVAVLDRCADPGNAGTAIRTAAAAGADAIVLSSGSVDAWSGKALRSSAGSIFHLPVVTSVATLDALEVLRGRGCQLLATAADGEVDLDGCIDSGGLQSPTAWLFGNEAHGLSDELRAAVDRTVRIPLYGPAESLNLAASVAVCLYASARSQR
jgi:TrmH family RNA methyltransferase